MTEDELLLKLDALGRRISEIAVLQAQSAPAKGAGVDPRLRGEKERLISRLNELTAELANLYRSSGI